MAKMIPEKNSQEPETKDGEVDRGAISTWVRDIFTSFKSARQPYEDMWIECWYNYLAKYQQETAWRPQTEGQDGGSRIFIKATTLKCNTAHAKIMEMAFPTGGGEEVPFDITPVRTALHDSMQISDEDLRKQADALKKRLKDHHRVIELVESIDNGVLEMSILGTAVIKGPIIDYFKIKKFSPRMVYGLPVSHFDSSINPHEIVTEDTPLPTWKHIPLWSYYCNPNSDNNRKSIMEIHFDRLLPSEFLALKEVGGYRADVIEEVKGQATVKDDTEDFKYVQMADNYTGQNSEKDKLISVIEAWGLVKAGDLRAVGTKEYPVDVDAKYKDEDLVEALVVLAGDGEVIKACMNPMGKRVFNVCPYKKIPHSIYGNGVAWAMRDSQKMINSAYRMIIDNKAITGPGMLAVNIDRINTKKTKDMSIYPKKVWYVKGNIDPKQAIDTVKFTDVTRELRDLALDFDRFSDEETGIPKFETGQQASFLNKTASGMSMLMRRTDVNIRPVIKNIDDFWIEPIIEAEGEWFMEMDPDMNIKVPHTVKATGTSTLIANEIKMENMAKFMQVTANPSDAMFVNRPQAIKNYARMLDQLDIMRTDDEIKKIMEEMSKRANEPKDLREFIAMDKLYPFLTVAEKAQLLTQLGIQPDVQGMQILQALDNNLKSAKANADNAKATASSTPAPAPAPVAPKEPAPAAAPHQTTMHFNIDAKRGTIQKSMTIKKNAQGEHIVSGTETPMDGGGQ